MSARHVSLLLLALPSMAWPATLHLVLVGDTLDSSIGKSVVIDLDNVERRAREVADATGLRLALTTLRDRDFTYSKVVGALGRVNPAPDDVLWFYYSGHGYQEQSGSKWPTMFVKGGPSGVTFDTVTSSLSRRAPRFLLVLFDSCNSYVEAQRGFSARFLAKANVENYRRLFVEWSGQIYASSSIPGQYSFGREDVGGLFTSAFLAALESYVRSPNPSQWDDIMREAAQPIRVNNPSQSSQNPQYEVRQGSNVYANVDPQPAPAPPDALPDELTHPNDTPPLEVDDGEGPTEPGLVEQTSSASECADLGQVTDALRAVYGGLPDRLDLKRPGAQQQAVAALVQELSDAADVTGDDDFRDRVDALAGAFRANDGRGFKRSLADLIAWFDGMRPGVCGDDDHASAAGPVRRARHPGS